MMINNTNNEYKIYDDIDDEKYQKDKRKQYT